MTYYPVMIDHKNRVARGALAAGSDDDLIMQGKGPRNRGGKFLLPTSPGAENPPPWEHSGISAVYPFAEDIHVAGHGRMPALSPLHKRLTDHLLKPMDQHRNRLKRTLPTPLENIISPKMPSPNIGAMNSPLDKAIAGNPMTDSPLRWIGII